MTLTAKASQRDDINSKYNHIYRDVHTFVEGYIAARGRSLTTYRELKSVVPILWAKSAGADIKYDILDDVVTWKSGSTLKSCRRAYMIADVDSTYADEVRRLAHGCDLVLDLGCGWGHRMVDVYLRGVNSTFYGGDRSKYSKKTTELVTGIFSEMRASWFDFDFTAPDFSSIDGDFKNVFVFSCHAVEQVENIDAELFNKLISRFGRVKGLFLEPVASQLDNSRKSEAEYASKRRYNRNLVDVIKSHSKLVINRTETAIVDLLDSNPTSLIEWQTLD